MSAASFGSRLSSEMTWAASSEFPPRSMKKSAPTPAVRAAGRCFANAAAMARCTSSAGARPPVERAGAWPSSGSRLRSSLPESGARGSSSSRAKRDGTMGGGSVRSSAARSDSVSGSVRFEVTTNATSSGPEPFDCTRQAASITPSQRQSSLSIAVSSMR